MPLPEAVRNSCRGARTSGSRRRGPASNLRWCDFGAELGGAGEGGDLFLQPVDFGGEDGVGGAGEDVFRDLGVEGGEGGGGVFDVF